MSQGKAQHCLKYPVSNGWLYILVNEWTVTHMAPPVCVSECIRVLVSACCSLWVCEYVCLCLSMCECVTMCVCLHACVYVFHHTSEDNLQCSSFYFIWDRILCHCVSQAGYPKSFLRVSSLCLPFPSLWDVLESKMIEHLAFTAFTRVLGIWTEVIGPVG